jgi:glycolate oxidase iron-sulfur subunit
MRSWTAGSTSSSSPICSGSRKPLTAQGPEQCARCGSCTAVCPVYRVTGRESLTARGKLHLLGTGLAAAPSPVFQDLFAQCLLCGACEQACPRGLPIRNLIVEARSRFPALYGRHSLRKAAARFALGRPALLEGLVQAGVLLSNLELLPADSGLRLKLGLLTQGRAAQPFGEETSTVPPAGGESIQYFAGCLARYLQPSVAQATGRLVQGLSGKPLHTPQEQACCGLAAWSSGNQEEARRLAKRNIRAFAGSSGPIVTSCASCSAHLARYPELFAGDPRWLEEAEQFSTRVREFTSFILAASGPAVLRAREPRRVYYHQPCHLRYDPDKAGVAGTLLRQVAGVIVAEPEAGPQCCGQGGLFHLGYPELADRIFATAHAACSATAADLVVTSCSGCLLQWQAGLALRHSPLPAAHLAVFLASCLDINS